MSPWSYQDLPFSIAERGPPLRRLISGLVWSALGLLLLSIVVFVLMHVTPERTGAHLLG
jgi:hypothetical protein